MKLIMAAVPFLMLSSCEENMEDLFPSEYQKVLSIKNSGQSSLVMASAAESYSVDIIVLKGGGNPSSDSEMSFRVMTDDEVSDGNPSSDSEMSFRVMTDDEVSEEWNWSPSQVEIIGEEGFEIEGGDNIVIPADESYRRISLTLHPSAIAAMTKQDSETWILPLVLESSTDNVNQDMNKMLYTLDLRDLALEWDDFQDETMTVEITYLERQVPLTMVMAYAEANEFTFTATLDDSRTDELVTAFNASHGTDYLALPASALSAPEFSFAPGIKESSRTVTLSRTGLESDRTYLLPLDFTVSDDAVSKSEEMKYLIVTNPKYSMEDVDQTSFSIAFANSETGWGWVASNLIDGEAGNGVTSAWSSKYDGDLASDDYDDFVYSFVPIERWVHHPDYPFCERCRALSDTYIVIDMKEDITLGAVGFGKWSDEWGDRVLKDCRVDLADEFIFRTVQDGGTAADYTDVSNGTVGWKEAFDCKGMSQDKAACQWFTVSDTEGATLQSGRYMRLNTYGTSHPGNPYCAAFTEIYVKKVVAVDGVRLE